MADDSAYISCLLMYHRYYCQGIVLTILIMYFHNLPLFWETWWTTHYIYASSPDILPVIIIFVLGIFPSRMSFCRSYIVGGCAQFFSGIPTKQCRAQQLCSLWITLQMSILHIASFWNLGSELPGNALPQNKLFSEISVFTRKLPGKYSNFPLVMPFPPVCEPGLTVR